MVLNIPNWEKYNPRTDVKRPSWFRLENNIFDNPDFFDFNNAELLSLFYVLSCASKKASSGGVGIRINFKHLEVIGRLNKKDFLGAIKKLETLQVVAVADTDTVRERNEDVTTTVTTNVRTNERTVEERKKSPRKKAHAGKPQGAIPEFSGFADILCDVTHEFQTTLLTTYDKEKVEAEFRKLRTYKQTTSGWWEKKRDKTNTVGRWINRAELPPKKPEEVWT